MAEARLSAGNGSLEVSGNHERSYAFRLDFLLRKGIPVPNGVNARCGR